MASKYKIDLVDIYQNTYSFRSYGDYRKRPEMEEKFNRSELKVNIQLVEQAIKTCLEFIGKRLDIQDLLKRLFD